MHSRARRFGLIAGAWLAAMSAHANESWRGLPFIRSYSYEEIGDVSRGARLNFDRFDRLAVIHRGAYVVLNDGTWIELAGRSDGDRSVLDLVKGPDGVWYYGALGGWGVADITAEGKLGQRSLAARDKPAWTTTTSFTYVVPTSDSVYFGGWNGVVGLNVRTKKQFFVAVPEVACVFTVGDQLFVSSHRNGLLAVDSATGQARLVRERTEEFGAVDQAAAFDATHALVSTTTGRMFVFDGTEFTPWNAAMGNGPDNRVSALQTLPDGKFAVAVSGRGLFVTSRAGEIQMALTLSEYQRVTYVASHEPGVLWVANETGVDKVLYGAPVTVFGQRLGLPVSWPQVVQWGNRVIVASSGRLYSAVPGTDGHAARFELMAHQPPPAAWGLASRGSQLLVGTSLGVFRGEADGQFEQILSMDVARLVMVADDLCYVIGTDAIAVLQLIDGHWRQIAGPVAGVGYPSVVHAFGRSAWIELGPNRAARVWLRDGQLHTRVFDSFPWPDSSWINLGMIGHTVILSGTAGKRVYFDEDREAITAAPQLDALLRRAPFPCFRVDVDSRGLIWTTYDRGIFTIARDTAGDHFDSAFDVIDDRTPFIYILPNDDVWVSTGQSLYHVDRTARSTASAALQPRLISVTDGQNNSELVHLPDRVTDVLRLSYEQNNLGLRFFAGGYNYRRAPAYEFKFGSAGEWTSAGNGSRLTFPGLREGRYHLGVRLTDARGPLGTPLAIDLEIQPPWYRTWYALLGYAAAIALAIYGLIRWSMQRARQRNLELEELVRHRTDELQATMVKLNEETRHAATLAERHRLAGEIHDSVQQGLSGLMLQLDATLKLSALSEAVRSRLTVARNMVSFTRHEVQHAVWNLESPLLEDADLGEALRKLARLISPGVAQIDVVVSGLPRALTPIVKHDLLRIAQEALTNAVRHAEPSHITLALAYEPDRVELAVIDNGKGFDPETVLAQGAGHFGLRGVRARAQKISGELDIESRPGTGTVIRVSVATHEPRITHPATHAPV